jgi:hypothetical protein
MTYMRSWKSHRRTSHTWLGLNPQIGRPLSRIVVPLVYFFFFYNSPGADWPLWQCGENARLFKAILLEDILKKLRLFLINLRVLQRFRGFLNTFLVELRLF